MLPVRLSILIPVFNEANSIKAVLNRVVIAPAAFFEAQHVLAEIIVVDDGSSDKSCAVIEQFAIAYQEVELRLIRHASNAGKGAAIRTAIAYAQSDFCIIQDADFEYDPADYPKLLKPLIADEADVVLGSRFMSNGARRPLGFWQAVANRSISMAAGIAAGLDLSDVETGFKAFRTSLAQSVPLRGERFGLDPEIVIQFARRHARFMEVPISFRGRTAEQGKKIRAWDAVHAFSCILRTALLSRRHTDPAADMLVAMSRAKRFNRWMAESVASWIHGQVLELGAGIGNLTVLLSAGGQRYLATDTDKESLFELRSRVDYRPNVELALFDFARPEDVERFRACADTVICINVLEHVEHDREALEHIHCCLRPGGTAIILVPQDPKMFGVMDEVLHHKRRYTREELREKMSAAGFTVERIDGFNRATRPGWYLNSRLLKKRTLSRPQLRLFDLLVPLWRRVDSKLPWPATSLIAIGKVDQPEHAAR